MSTVIAEDAGEVAEQLIGAGRHLVGSRVLVTGATGMLGRYVVEVLLQLSARLDHGVHVTALARDEDKARRCFGELAFDGRSPSDNFDVVIADVADASALDGDRPVEHIVHAASPASPRLFRADPVGVIRANVLGTFALLELARRHNAHVSLISTMEVYGEVHRPDESADALVTEDDAGVVDSLALRSAYPESKRLAETLSVAYCAQHGVRSDIVRLSHTYGPGMQLDDGRVQAEFMRQALTGEDIVLKSDGSLRRTYTYVADAASAVLHILLTAPSRAETTAFNVADDSSRTTIRELAETILVASGRPATDLRVEVAADSMWSKVSGATYLDCSRLKSLGWSVQYPLSRGIERTVRHSRAVLSAAGQLT